MGEKYREVMGLFTQLLYYRSFIFWIKTERSQFLSSSAVTARLLSYLTMVPTQLVAIFYFLGNLPVNKPK